jgi:purine-binding chemotaxis protein CheW
MTTADTIDADTLEYVTLVAGGQGFGIEIRQIREIRRWSQITTLPHAPSGVLGVINLRGAVVPIVDLAVRLGLGDTADSGRNVFVIVQVESRTLGLLVDSVSEIIEVRRDRLRDVPSVGGFGGADCVAALIETGEDMIRVVDLRAVMPMLDGTGL